MGLLARLSRLGWQKRKEHRAAKKGTERTAQRRCFFETMEPRCLLDADPLQIGATYLEQDFGGDTHGDTFEVTFQGGAADTQLTRLIIDGDQGSPGLDQGDMIFDTEAGGLGADEAIPFTLIEFTSQDANASVTATVTDGGHELVLDLVGFRAGDRLVFSIDVDEIEGFDPLQSDLQLINDEIDPIASGVEFQGSMLRAEFSADHFFDISGSAAFRNRYDAALIDSGLDLPADNAGGLADRSDGAFIELRQQVMPVTISGTVYLDRDVDLRQDANDPGLAGVELQLWQQLGGTFQSTGHVTQTDTDGNYSFGLDLELKPGVYQLREVQPDGLFSVGASAGSVAGRPTGIAGSDPDVLTQIMIPLGNQHAIDMDFAESEPSSISGNVHLSDEDGNCFGDTASHAPLAGVVVRLLDAQGNQIAETTTGANGSYEFQNLRHGVYSVVEVQPAGLLNGGQHIGTVDAVPSGSADQDVFRQIVLASGQAATNYDFCEHEPASLAGTVFHDFNDNGVRDAGEDPIANVTLELRNEAGAALEFAQTGSDGSYLFQNLLAGTYTVTEVQPSGWTDGQDHAGTVVGQTRGIGLNDRIESILLRPGENAIDYDFGEIQLASIGGVVHTDPNFNCLVDAGDAPLADVQVELLDRDGHVLATQLTRDDGTYRFEGLRPGSYSVRQLQPQGYLEGGQSVGTVAGAASGIASLNLLSGIVLNSGQAGMDFNFCEQVPATLAGSVFHDMNDNGLREAGETPIGDVVIALRDSEGQLVATTTTASDGTYQFGQLPAGSYSVIQSQPTGWTDGKDAAGTVAGESRGVASNDRIDTIRLQPGENGVDFDFGEIRLASISGVVHTDPNANCVVDNGDVPLANVRIELLDRDGAVLSTQLTKADGSYRFDGLRPGTYSIREIQPQGYLEGGQRVGTVDGTLAGTEAANVLHGISLLSGQAAIDFNFCEQLPATLAGSVFHDVNDNGVLEPAEAPIANVVIELRDGTGALVGTTTTNSDGAYEFQGLPVGVYSVIQSQPAGWMDGGDAAGTVAGERRGVAGNDRIDNITLRPGETGVDFNFGEIKMASIAGFVHTDPNRNCIYDNGDSPLANVTVELVGVDGNVLATQQTGGDGSYLFDGLRPGTYSVREVQPDGMFHGGQRAGSHGGEIQVDDAIGQIRLVSGDEAINYNFCESPASRLSGYVFQDGDVIETEDGEPPANLADIRDGVRTSDDTPIAGVVIELRNGLSGVAIDASEALPGYYEPGPITATTDANGYYEFTGLRGGASYAVYQVQPDGFVDGIDVAGTTTGIPFNAGGPVNEFVVSQLTKSPGTDAIVRIPLGVATTSQENNFSEVVVVAAPEPPVYNPPPSIPTTPSISLPPPASPPPLVAPAIFNPVIRHVQVNYIGAADFAPQYTWHLSVIDAGMPRDLASATPSNAMHWSASQFITANRWNTELISEGRWQRGVSEDHANESDPVSNFGIRGGKAIVGDFNGDGIDELGIFYQGEWFIDVNGNGVWDEDDLWVRLGSENDLPVTGDWNGDGKDDIGIFGPEWAGDENALRHEPGLPDAQNLTLGRPKNVPPEGLDATDGQRLMQLHKDGMQRADVIDHVIRFGANRSIPVAGDFNGDGIRTIGVFRDGLWWLDVDGDGRWSDRDAQFEYGEAGDVPVVGDLDGNGVEEIGIYRSGQWILDTNGNRELDAHDRVFEMGGASDQPVMGDWDGDGVDEPGIYTDRPGVDRDAA